MAVGGNICMIRAMGNCHVRITSKALVMGGGLTNCHQNNTHDADSL